MAKLSAKAAQAAQVNSGKYANATITYTGSAVRLAAMRPGKFTAWFWNYVNSHPGITGLELQTAFSTQCAKAARAGLAGWGNGQSVKTEITWGLRNGLVTLA